MDYVFKRGARFIIDKDKLKPAAQKAQVINSLYGAIYREFVGASKNPSYFNLTVVERMGKLNDFCEEWLKNKGLY